MRSAVPKLVGRPATKQLAILDYIRKQILNGELKPGSRVITRQELGEIFNASAMTVQQALGRLVADGFVVARGNAGTFVSEHPPHLARYALVFPYSPGNSSWSRFYGALSDEAIQVGRSRAIVFESFYELDGHPDREDYQKLLREVQAHRLAGIIFATQPSHLVGTPLLDEPDLPRVAIMSERFASLVPTIPRVSPDHASFINQAADFFLSRGRKKIAFIMLAQADDAGMDTQIVKAIEDRGMRTELCWQQAVCSGHPQWARNIVQMLLRGSPSERPDGLLISDDNFVEHAIRGMIDSGLKVPDDLDVVAHCNFPWPVPSSVPVQRLGFDAREVLRVCIDMIDRQRAGETVSSMYIPAMFEK